MAFFRRKPKFPTTGHLLDDATMQQLAEHGIDFDAPRDWVHYVYCSTEDGAAQMTRDAQATGWTVRRTAGGIGIIASRDDMPVNSTTVRRVRVFFEGLAASVADGDYDGWEASV